MFFRLFLLFTVVPLVELALLLYLSDLTDWRFTLGLVVVSGVIGTWLARSEGFRTYRRIQQELQAGRLPGAAMVDAAMIFAAGALLVTPGILTDLFGLTLLIPPCRAFYRQRLISWFQAHFTVQSFPPGAGDRFGSGPEVIDSHVVPRDPEP
ncbi:MAG: FxsA family protein [Pirellulaceae bacterium]|nr:FxsA family protein [Pirellulaceae bacterium]